jgi:ribonuclease PH
MARNEGRANNEMRKINVIKDFIIYPAGSVLIEVGNTKVSCSATVENKVPPFLRDKKTGWVTAEYSMMPSSTHSRTQREASKGKLSGRTQEIQRLIGRSLRTVVDMDQLGERTVWIDCDVIQADGGTRCASITGAFIALSLALKKLHKENIIETIPIKDYVAAISVGIAEGQSILDLNYDEDSSAEVDLNIVKTGSGGYVEIQGTAEREPFNNEQLETLLALADKGVKELIEIQKSVIEIA